MVILLMMAGPGVAGMICAFLFEPAKHRGTALGIRLRANWWWLLAYGIGVGLSTIALIATILLGGGSFVPPHAIRSFALSWLLINPVVQTVLATVMEELGWRGYLYALWRQIGFWRYSLATGLLWGIWHAPGIILFKLNYPDNPWVGAAVFVPLCMLYAPLVTLVRDNGKSVIAAGILHGTANATDLAGTLMVTTPSALWHGDTGIGGFIAIAFSLVLIALIRRKELDKAIPSQMSS